MPSVTMLDFRKSANRILRNVREGQRITLTYRGKPVARIEPIIETAPGKDDPFFHLSDLAEQVGDSLTNEEIDETLYGRSATNIR